MITVDTEGFDAHVLMGAAATLASGQVHYLEFEYHSRPPWSEFQLETLVAFLDNLAFDCYFAGNDGRAYKMTGCWRPAFEFHQWSNVVCASRRLEPATHACWHSALEAASGI